MNRNIFETTLAEDRQGLTKGLKQPFLIIENALVSDFAEQLHDSLMGSDAWQKSDPSSFTAKERAMIPEGYSFSREIINLNSEDLPVTARHLYEQLNSEECLHWFSKVCGRRCDEFTGACARYYGGNHLTSHNDYYMKKQADNSVATRALTFNYYLTKNWDSEWGGNFVWEHPRMEIIPSFNTLVLFPVGTDSMHHVEQVSASATEPRLAFTGWFMTNRKPGERTLNIS